MLHRTAEQIEQDVRERLKTIRAEAPGRMARQPQTVTLGPTKPRKANPYTDRPKDWKMNQLPTGDRDDL